MSVPRVLLRKTSLVDYPGTLASVIFFSGCNLRCPWCHNRELVLGGPLGKNGGPPPGGENSPLEYITPEEALAHLEKRRGILGGAVLSGGEPTLFAGLGPFIGRIKSLGLRVKLDTNGTRPAILRELFASEETRPDYVALDLKTAPDRYRELLPGPSPAPVPRPAEDPGEALKESAALLRASGIAHEFRSLALPPPWFGGGARAALAPLAGDSPWRVRPFVPGNCLDPAWNALAGAGK